MAHFFKLQDSLDEAAKVYFAMLGAASDNSATEKAAIIKVQSVYRGSKVRDRWHAVLHNALLVQRLSRGWLARVRTRALRLERTMALNTVFFHHCASVIQKFFRGWWSRRYLHDYYGRKGYLEKVAKRGDWTKEYLRRHHENKVAEAKAEEETQMRQEFDNLAGELHHLVSTKSIAGVYNPPYNDVLPKAFEKPIEQHLRDSCKVRLPKSLRRPRHRSTPHGVASGGYLPTSPMDYPVAGPPQDLPDRAPHHSRSASVGRMQKIQGPFRNREQIEVANAKATTNFKTIQSSAPYDLVDKDAKMQTRLNKLTRVSPVDFMAPGNPSFAMPPASVHATAPYRDRPAELRQDYCELPRIRDKPPFFTALPRDKHFHDYQEQELLPFGAV